MVVNNQACKKENLSNALSVCGTFRSREIYNCNYAIAPGSIARGGSPGRIKRNMPDPIPALILGRLAVDQGCQGAGIGQGLLKDALARSINVPQQIGARVLIFHALNNKAEAFYLKHGFMVNLAISNTLLLPLLTKG